MRACAEIGCGAGRLTAALVQDFASVHVLDISPERIEQTRNAVGRSSVSFHLIERPCIPLPNGCCDLCISTHVLQHITSMQVMEVYLCEARRALRPGGCLLVHVPVIGTHGMTGNLSEVMRRRGKEIVKGAVLAITRLLRENGVRRLPWKADHYRVFSFVRLKTRLLEIGFGEIELRILPWAGGHGYVFAKNPPNSNLDTRTGNAVG